MRILILVTLAVLVSAAPFSQATPPRDYVVITGSSTAYPFATVVAERVGKTTGFRTPQVNAFGSGGGIRQFCGGIGPRYPDIVLASRR
ncbi:MAG: substrate-binding domain-containing protein, partial [Gammaproteobacteria bacterium]|nr:substrate-binding domain-containing protein [Gammaproteobacteria bacterium]